MHQHFRNDGGGGGGRKRESSYPSSAASTSSSHGGYIPWNGTAVGESLQSTFTPSQQYYNNDHWERHVDAKSGLTYFANSYTGESRWSDDAKWIMMEQSRRDTSLGLSTTGYSSNIDSEDAYSKEIQSHNNPQQQRRYPNVHLDSRPVSMGRRDEDWDQQQQQQHHQQQYAQPLHPWQQQDLRSSPYQRSLNTSIHSSSSFYLQNAQSVGGENEEDGKEETEENGGGNFDATFTSISPPSSLSPSTPVMFTPRGEATPSYHPGDVHHQYHPQEYHPQDGNYPPTSQTTHPPHFSSYIPHVPFVSKNHHHHHSSVTDHHNSSVTDYSSLQATRRQSLSKGAAIRGGIETNYNAAPWQHQRFSNEFINGSGELAPPDSSGSGLVQSPSRGDRSSSRRERRRRAERSILESRRFFAAAFHPNGIDASEDKTLRGSGKDSSSDISEKQQQKRVPRLYDTPPSSDVDAEENIDYETNKNTVYDGQKRRNKNEEEDEEGDDDDGTLAEALADGAALVHPDDDVYEKNDYDEFGEGVYLNDDVESGLAMPVANEDPDRPLVVPNEDEDDIRQAIARDQFSDNRLVAKKSGRMRRSKSQRARDAATNFVGMTLEQRAAWLRMQLASVGGGIASDAYAVAALISEKSVPWVQGFLGAVVIAAGVVRNTGLAGGSLVGGVSARDYVRTVSAEAALQMSPTGEIPISLRNVHQQVRETNASATAKIPESSSAHDEGTGYATCEDDLREEGHMHTKTQQTSSSHSANAAIKHAALSVQKSTITLTDVLFSAGAVKRLLRPCAEAASSALMSQCPPLEGGRYFKESEEDAEALSRIEKLEKGKEEEEVVGETIKSVDELSGKDSGMAKERASFFASAPNGMLSPSKLPV